MTDDYWSQRGFEPLGRDTQAADACRNQSEGRDPNRIKISFDLDTGKLTLPRGRWELVVTGAGSATINTVTVISEPEDFVIRDLHQMETLKW
jgi:hypothetical protein